MSSRPPALNQTPCTIRHLRYSSPYAQCDRCGQLAPRVWEVSRTAVDINLEGPVLLLVTVSVHRCSTCSGYFRAQPPFLRRNAVYAERVREKAVLSVYEDGMPFRKVTGRLARDFWVAPSEAMIRRWCKDFTEGLDFEALYPNSLKEVWPTAAHQLCLFHETRLVTGEVYKARAAPRKSVPKVPQTIPSKPLLGRPSKCPIPEKLAAHRAAIARVLTLHEQGVSIRGIRRRTGHSRNTIKRWLRGEIPKEISEAELPTEWMLEKILGEGVSQQEEPLTPEVPSAYSSWEEVRKVRNLLWDVRYVILCRPEHLTEKDREKLGFLCESAVGEEVRLLRSFLEEWYLLFHDEQHKRRTLAEAKERYDRLKDNPDYQKLEHLAGLQARFSEEHFQKVSCFLEHEEWEATNNGVERTGRAFRHLQRSRYNFREPASIEDTIRARAWLAKEGSSLRSTPPPGRCTRGRKAGYWFGVPAAA